MKKTLFAILVIAIALSAVSCGTTEVKGSEIKGEAPTISVASRTMIDYQGSDFGSPVPAWVMRLSQGNYDSKAFVEFMPDLKDKKIFVVQNRGPNLDFLKSWSEAVDIERQVAATMERVIGKATQSTSDAISAQNSSNTRPEDKEVELKDELHQYTASLQNVRLTGLEKVSEYWTQMAYLDEDGNVTDSSYYNYYAIYAIDKKAFKAQMDAAMDRVEETTTESEKLKQVIGQNLEKSMNFADVEVIDNSNED